MQHISHSTRPLELQSMSTRYFNKQNEFGPKLCVNREVPFCTGHPTLMTCAGVFVLHLSDPPSCESTLVETFESNGEQSSFRQGKVVVPQLSRLSFVRRVDLGAVASALAPLLQQLNLRKNGTGFHNLESTGGNAEKRKNIYIPIWRAVWEKIEIEMILATNIVCF